MNTPLDPRLRLALTSVLDPEMGQDVVRLGLIYGATLDPEGTARITMTTTTRGCPLSAVLRESIADAALQVEDVLTVEVTLTYDPPWTPARVDADGEGALYPPLGAESRHGGWRAWMRRVFSG